jgi:4-hydroxymandelate synthase
MAARRVEYVELYVADKKRVVDYFETSMGFDLVAESTDQGNSSALLRQAEVQLVVTEGPQTSEFLSKHGDGVADVALACDDVDEIREAARAAGALISDTGRPVASGFGDTRHTVLPYTGHAGFPEGRDWTPAPETPASAAKGIEVLDHVAVCVEGGALTSYADFYGEVFGLPRYSGEYIEVDGQAMDSIVVRSPSGGVTFTLVAPDPAKKAGQLDRFLRANSGPGVQHLAFRVDDIIRASRKLGVEFLDTPGAYYDALIERLPGLEDEIASLRAANVLADRDEGGYLLQAFTRSPYERNTLFYELVERRGARGFGAANIRALYEAVARDQRAGT